MLDRISPGDCCMPYTLCAAGMCHYSKSFFMGNMDQFLHKFLRIIGFGYHPKAGKIQDAGYHDLDEVCT